MEQRRAAARDAVDVDDRLLQQDAQHVEVARLQRNLEGGSVGRVAQVQRGARVEEQLDDGGLAGLGADHQRRLPARVLLGKLRLVAHEQPHQPVVGARDGHVERGVARRVLVACRPCALGERGGGAHAQGVRCAPLVRGGVAHMHRGLGVRPW